MVLVELLPIVRKLQREAEPSLPLSSVHDPQLERLVRESRAVVEDVSKPVQPNSHSHREPYAYD
jgi:hypothetical protein